MKIWIFVTDDDNGTNTEVFTDEALATAAAQAWVTYHWDEDDGEQPETWQETMEILVDRMFFLDRCNITEHTLPVHPALVLADEMCRVALPKFNWGASALDAESIDLLNRGQIAIRKAVRG